MEKIRCLAKRLPRTGLMVVLVLALVLTGLSEPALSGAKVTGKAEVVRSVAEKWIQVGTEQYQRGMYKYAEQSLLRAKNYEQYLSDAQRTELDELLAKTQGVSGDRDRVVVDLKSAKKLLSEGRQLEAKILYESILSNDALSKQERKYVSSELSKINKDLVSKKSGIIEVYNRSVKLYNAGELEKARAGFVEVIQSGLVPGAGVKAPQDYLIEIDNILVSQLQYPVVEVVVEEDGCTECEKAQSIEDQLLESLPEFAVKGSVVVVEAVPGNGEGSYIETVNRKISILRGHTRAIVNDAINKSHTLMSECNFNEARRLVEGAERTVNENHLNLGDGLYEQYSNQLYLLADQIDQSQSQAEFQLAEQKKLDAI